MNIFLGMPFLSLRSLAPCVLVISAFGLSACSGGGSESPSDNADDTSIQEQILGVWYLQRMGGSDGSMNDAEHWVRADKVTRLEFFPDGRFVEEQVGRPPRRQDIPYDLHPTFEVDEPNNTIDLLFHKEVSTNLGDGRFEVTTEVRRTTCDVVFDGLTMTLTPQEAPREFEGEWDPRKHRIIMTRTRNGTEEHQRMRPDAPEPEPFDPSHDAVEASDE